MKKHLLLLTLAFAACFTGANADELTVANGTGTQDLGPLYDDGTNGFTKSTGYVEILYPKSLLTKADNDMSGANITGVTYYSNLFTFTGGTVEVQICETDNANLNSEITETPTTVTTITGVQNSYNASTGEFFLDFSSTPFAYSGEKNLLVRVNVTAKGTKDGRSKFYYNTTYSELGSTVTVIRTSYTTKSGYGNTYYMPKTKFTFVKETKEWEAKANPAALTFGDVPVGSESSLDITLKNTGANAFTPSLTFPGNAYSTTWTPVALANGESATIPVKFAPSQAGNYDGTLAIDCGSAGIVEVALSGSASLSATVADGSASSEKLPVYGYNYDGAQTSQMIYPASMLTSLKGKKLTGMTFYFTGPSYGTKTFFYGGNVAFSLANTTVESFTSTTRITEGLQAVASVVPQNGTVGEWVITFDDGFVYDGSNLLLDVVTQAGTWANITFNGEAGHTGASFNNNDTVLDFLPKVKFNYEEVEGTVSVDLTSYDFGEVFVDGEAVTKELTVSNTTDADATLALTGLEGTQFSATSEVTTVAAGGTATVTVTYAPSATAQKHNATLTIVDGVTVELAGETVEHVISGTVNPTSLSLSCFEGNTATDVITIANTGNTAFTPVFSTPEAPFSVSAAQEIAAGESMEFTVTYAPEAIDIHNGSFTVTIGAQEPVTVTLSGNCYEAPSEAVVCDGTDENAIVPFHGYYTDTDGVYGQMIYPADMLQALNGKYISALKFYSSTGIQFSGCTFNVTIGNIAQSEFSGTSRVAVTGGVSATVTPAKNDTEIEITFSEPLKYEGGNLIVDTYVATKTSYSNSDPSNGATKYYGMNQTATTAINSKGGSYGTAGSANFLPKVTFTLVDGPASLAEALEAADGDKLTIGDDMAVVVANSNYAIVSDGKGNWLKLTGANGLEKDAVIKNVTGTMAGMSANPTMAVDNFVTSEATVGVQLASYNFASQEAPKANEVLTITGNYQEDGTITQFSGKNGEVGESIAVNTAFCPVVLEAQKTYTFTGVAQVAENTPAGAPALAPAAFSGMTLDIVGADVPTGVNTIKAFGGKDVEAIYNLNGQRVNSMDKGIYILRHTDGTTSKVMR